MRKKYRKNEGDHFFDGKAQFLPTLYQTYLWTLANTPDLMLSERLREGLKAWMTASSSFCPAIEDLLMQARSERRLLSGTSYQQRIQSKIDDILEEAENFFVSLSDQEQDEIEQLELHQRLLAFRRDILTETEVIIALHDFGESGYLEARPEIERLLRSRNPELRSRALEVLVGYWRLPEYEVTLWKFLHDPSPQCRREAITYLSALYEDDPDQRVLSTLAYVVMNPGEQKHIRLYAYELFLERSGYRIEEGTFREALNLFGKGGTFEQVPGVRWDLLRCFDA